MSRIHEPFQQPDIAVLSEQNKERKGNPTIQ